MIGLSLGLWHRWRSSGFAPTVSNTWELNGAAGTFWELNGGVGYWELDR